MRGLTAVELDEVRAFPHAGNDAAADTLIAALLATIDEANRMHNRWVSATYGRDGADSVLLYKSQHAKLERAWYGLTTVAQWDEIAAEKVAEIQAMEEPR